jgi:hypothetical protein
MRRLNNSNILKNESDSATSECVRYKKLFLDTMELKIKKNNVSLLICLGMDKNFVKLSGFFVFNLKIPRPP